ncbi:MAG TPA: GntR family transcriptional regulator [Desulfomonilaceae bacterium]|nr:GntR family transcriptional regulator [Desulfomonilaceae bacterium]
MKFIDSGSSRGYHSNMRITLVKQRLSEQAYRVLRDMITNARFQRGTRLNIERLARDMEVSRTPLWEAVHRLIQEGLLVSIPNRGVFIIDLTPEAALELYTVREVLEGLAVRLACQHVDDKAITRMEKSLNEQYEMTRELDLIGYSKHDFDFHAVIYELSGNKFLREMLDAIRSKTRPTSMDFMPLLQLSYKDHMEVLQALKARDPVTAEKAIRNHIRRLIEALENPAGVAPVSKKRQSK